MIMILENISILIWIRVVLFRKDQMKKLFLFPILLLSLISSPSYAESPSQLISSLSFDHQSWVKRSCPEHLGPRLWSNCVKREVSALRSGMPDLATLSSDNKNWVNRSCPKHLGPLLWSNCVKREVRALKGF